MTLRLPTPRSARKGGALALACVGGLFLAGSARAECSDRCHDWRPVEDALREAQAATSCDTAALRADLHRVRVEIAKATRPDEQSALWREFDWIAAAIKRCGTRT